jgi:CheY-like chemotaxis protein
VFAPTSEAIKLFSKLSILVVEDSAYMRKLLGELLHALEVGTILEAENGEDGWAKFQDYVPDIVLTDAAMEPTNGFDLLRRIRAAEDPRLATVPVVMITGHCEREAVELARDLGVTEYLAKPVTPVGLYSRLVEVAAHPRPFVRADGFFGPDRRRRAPNKYDGPERRRGRTRSALLDI